MNSQRTNVSRRRPLVGRAGIGSVATAGCLRLTGEPAQIATNEQGDSETDEQGGPEATDSTESTPTNEFEDATASGDKQSSNSCNGPADKGGRFESCEAKPNSANGVEPSD